MGPRRAIQGDVNCLVVAGICGRGGALKIKVWPEPISSGHTQSHTERKDLVGALVTQERGDGLEHDPRVEGEGAVLGVGEVQVDGLIPGKVRAAGNLPD